MAEHPLFKKMAEECEARGLSERTRMQYVRWATYVLGLAPGRTLEVVLCNPERMKPLIWARYGVWGRPGVLKAMRNLVGACPSPEYDAARAGWKALADEATADEKALRARRLEEAAAAGPAAVASSPPRPPAVPGVEVPERRPHRRRHTTTPEPGALYIDEDGSVCVQI